MFNFIAKKGIILLNGNKGTEMQIKTPQDIAKLVRQARKDAGLTQAKLAKLCGVGTRFIVDLEAGKPTCQLDKTLIVLHGLGIKLYDETSLLGLAEASMKFASGMQLKMFQDKFFMMPKNMSKNTGKDALSQALELSKKKDNND